MGCEEPVIEERCPRSPIHFITGAMQLLVLHVAAVDFEERLRRRQIVLTHGQTSRWFLFASFTMESLNSREPRAPARALAFQAIVFIVSPETLDTCHSHVSIDSVQQLD